MSPGVEKAGTDDASDVDEGSHLQEPPALNVKNVIDVIKRKGYVGAMQDEAMGPHIHLITILGVVVIIAVVVAAFGMLG